MPPPYTGRANGSTAHMQHAHKGRLESLWPPCVDASVVHAIGSDVGRRPGSCQAALLADRCHARARTVNRAWCAGQSASAARVLDRTTPAYARQLCSWQAVNSSSVWNGHSHAHGQRRGYANPPRCEMHMHLVWSIAHRIRCYCQHFLE